MSHFKHNYYSWYIIRWAKATRFVSQYL